jgi:hypothetical protein
MKVRCSSRYSVQGSSVERRPLVEKHIRQIDEIFSKAIGNSHSHLCYVVGICQANFSQLLCRKQSIEIAVMELRRLRGKKENQVYILGFDECQKLCVIAIQFCEHK